jgi:hypothetical protein
MSDRSLDLAQPLGVAEADGFVHTGLAEAVERGTTSRFLVVRAAARLALAVDAHVSPLVRLLRALASRLAVFTDSASPTTPSILRRSLLAVSASLMAIAAGVSFGILPGLSADLATAHSALGSADVGAAGYAASTHWGRSGGRLPTTPPPGLNVARLAWPPPATTAPSATASQSTQPPAVPPPIYVNPLAQIANLQPKRIDQGVDYAGSGPLLALGRGTIRSTTEAGWPGGAFITLQLADGQLAGQIVYYAENITPTVRVGQRVNVGDVVGILHDSYPNLEIGWGGGGAAGGTLGNTLARSNGGDVEGVSTAAGVNFNRLLTSLGAPGGIQQGLMGHIPAG